MKQDVIVRIGGREEQRPKCLSGVTQASSNPPPPPFHSLPFEIFHGTPAFRDLRQQSFVSHPPTMAFCLPSSTIYVRDPIHIQHVMERNKVNPE
jgi:hypothetical protein